LITDNLNGVDVSFPAIVILDSFGLDIDGYWRDLFIGFGFLVILLFVFLGMVEWRMKEKR
jgi:hypothetical protein